MMPTGVKHLEVLGVKSTWIMPKTQVGHLHTCNRRAPRAYPKWQAARKGHLQPPLEEVWVENQLQLARRFRLGLPELGLEELGIGNELRIA